jgi:hypothetical protein
MARERKFAALVERLRQLPLAESSLRLTLKEIELLADGPLPRGAWTSSYWSNSTVSRKNWRPHGFTARLERHACAVVFCRVGPPTGRAEGDGANPQLVGTAGRS